MTQACVQKRGQNSVVKQLLGRGDLVFFVIQHALAVVSPRVASSRDLILASDPGCSQTVVLVNL